MSSVGGQHAGEKTPAEVEPWRRAAEEIVIREFGSWDVFLPQPCPPVEDLLERSATGDSAASAGTMGDVDASAFSLSERKSAPTVPWDADSGSRLPWGYGRTLADPIEVPGGGAWTREDRIRAIARAARESLSSAPRPWVDDGMGGQPLYAAPATSQQGKKSTA